MTKIAVIGVGGAGANHANTLNGIEGVTLSMVVDQNECLAKQVSEQCGGVRYATDFHEALQDPDIIAVTVATPPSIREQIVIPAARAGKHILCEKPLAISLEQALRMQDACKNAGVKLMVNFGARNLPIFRKIKEMLDSGKYGTPEWIWLKYMTPARAGIFVPPDWFWMRETGGGFLVENAGHLLDFVNSIMPPAMDVVATTHTLEFSEAREGISVTPDVEDLALLTIRHEGGAVTSMANGCVGNGGWGVNMDIMTESHVISIRDTKNLRVEKDGIVIEAEEFKDRWNPIPYGVRRFVDFVNGLNDAVPKFDEAIAVLRIATGAYESAAVGRVVSIK
ncbi:MAG: Gfo/Idh/MocA family oxidoreductase [Phycisphaeraceae bacterium]|nr:Gfo/Idh/MocA family oxidoreductase [Phycisphaeraceae bacterium]